MCYTSYKVKALFLSTALLAFVWSANVPGHLSAAARGAESGQISPAGINVWSSSGPEGVNVVQVVANPGNPNTLYAATQRDGKGVYKTTDGGATWNVSNDGLVGAQPLSVDALAVDPSNQNVLYAGIVGLEGNAQVFQSINGGVTWGVRSNGINVAGVIQTLLVDPSNAAVVYAGTNVGGVFKTANGGANWNPVNLGLTDADVLTLAIDPVSPTTLYAGSNSSGVFKSVSGGTSWTPMNNGLALTRVHALAVDRVNPLIVYAGGVGGAYKTTDGGANWSPINNGVLAAGCPPVGGAPPAAAVTVFSLAIAPGNHNVLLAGTACNAYRSFDGGTSWGAAGGNLGNAPVVSLAINSADMNFVLAAHGIGGVIRSSDGGINWGQSSRGMTRAFVRALAVSPRSARTVYAGTSNGLYKSINYGMNWLPALPRDTDALAVDPGNPSIIYAGTPADGVFKSSDGGTSWTQINDGLVSTVILSLTIDPSAPNVVYAGDFRGVNKSVNGGASWHDASTGIVTPSTNVTALVVDPHNSSLLYAGTNGPVFNGLYRSNDGGANWGLANNGLAAGAIYALALDPANPAHLYASVLGAGVFQTTTSGADWSAANNGLTNLSVHALAIDPANPATLYAGALNLSSTEPSLFRSVNGGASWSSFTAGLPSGISVNALAVDPTGRSVHAGTDAGVYTYRYAPVPGRIATVGLYDSFAGQFYLRNSNTQGVADLAFNYGPQPAAQSFDWAAVVGDWDGDGMTTVGLYQRSTSTFFLRNFNGAGSADAVFSYGPAGTGWTPLAGDWNGDGIDTIGLFNPATSTFFLKNTNAAGAADLVFTYGPVTEQTAFRWTPVVGDWNGDGTDTVGLHDYVPATFYLKNTNAAGPADLIFVYGPAQFQWRPVAGDWNGDGIETVGLYNPDAGCSQGEGIFPCGAPTFYLKNTNAAGAADLAFNYGPEPSSLLPLVGDSDGL